MHRFILFVFFFICAIELLGPSPAYAQPDGGNSQESFVQTVDKIQILIIRFFPVLLAVCAVVALLCLLSICGSMVGIKKSCETNFSNINNHINKIENTLLLTGTRLDVSAVTIADLLQTLGNDLRGFGNKLVGPEADLVVTFATIERQLEKMNENLLRIDSNFESPDGEDPDVMITAAYLLKQLKDRLSVLGAVGAHEPTIADLLGQMNDSLCKIEGSLSGTAERDGGGHPGGG